MYDELAASFSGVKNELDVIKSQLEGVLPQLERASQASISDLEKRAGAAHAGLTTSIVALETRDREISDKLKATVQKIDTQLEGRSSYRRQRFLVCKRASTAWCTSSSRTWRGCARTSRGTWRMPL